MYTHRPPTGYRISQEYIIYCVRAQLFLSENCRNRESKDRHSSERMYRQWCIEDVIFKMDLIKPIYVLSFLVVNLMTVFPHYSFYTINKRLKCSTFIRLVLYIYPFFPLSDHSPLVLHTCRDFVAVDDPFKRFSIGAQFVLPIKPLRTSSPNLPLPQLSIKRDRGGACVCSRCVRTVSSLYPCNIF